MFNICIWTNPIYLVANVEKSKSRAGNEQIPDSLAKSESSLLSWAHKMQRPQTNYSILDGKIYAHNWSLKNRQNVISHRIAITYANQSRRLSLSLSLTHSHHNQNCFLAQKQIKMLKWKIEKNQEKPLIVKIKSMKHSSDTFLHLYL